MLIEFYGIAGSGKTTLVREIVKILREQGIVAYSLKKSGGVTNDYSYSLKEGKGFLPMFKTCLTRPLLLVKLFRLAGRIGENRFFLFLSLWQQHALLQYKRNAVFLSDHGLMQSLTGKMLTNVPNRSLKEIFNNKLLYENRLFIGVEIDRKTLKKRIRTSEKHFGQKGQMDLDNYFDAYTVVLQQIQNNMGDELFHCKNNNEIEFKSAVDKVVSLIACYYQKIYR